MEKMWSKHLLEDLKLQLIERAEARFPDHVIGPCGNKAHLSECFTVDDEFDYNIIMLWYNVSGEKRPTTHVESIRFNHTTSDELKKIGGSKNGRGKSQGTD